MKQVPRDYHKVGMKLDGSVHELGEGVIEVLPPHL
jgi:hypothetical protein